jgi:hypothetical protein
MPTYRFAENETTIYAYGVCYRVLEYIVPTVVLILSITPVIEKTLRVP